MGNDVEDKNMSQLLRTIRTSGTKTDEPAKRLLFLLTNKKEWTHQQCQNFYESVLRHYVDDADTLELLLAVSGILDGYRSTLIASVRRDKYLTYLDKNDSNSRYKGKDPETIRKEEDKQLAYIAQKLQGDLECGNISYLIEKWISKPAGKKSTNESKTSPLLPPTMPPVEELFPTAKDIKLIPGEIFQLKVAILPKEAVGAHLNFISLAPEIVTVSTNGMLKAENGQEKLWHNISRPSPLRALSNSDGRTKTTRQTAEIIIQAESGVTATKLITVDYSKGICKSSVEDINDFVPVFIVEPQIRLAGVNDWKQTMKAEVGDLVEIQIHYYNISDVIHKNVMVRNILPTNLVYIPGSTKVYNINHPTGFAISRNAVTTTGINIGDYKGGSNAYVRFTARVVDATLRTGSNTLVSWSQACVNRVTLQGYTTVTLKKT